YRANYYTHLPSRAILSVFSISILACALEYTIQMKHFLDLADWSTDDIRTLLDLAVRLKAELRNGGNEPVLKGKILGLIFQKPSLRTRVSFEVGMQQLGGTSIMLGP